MSTNGHQHNLDFFYISALVRSLCEGRNIYISNQKRWIELTDITVCIESSTKMKDDTPVLLTALVSKVRLAEVQFFWTEMYLSYAVV